MAITISFRTSQLPNCFSKGKIAISIVTMVNFSQKLVVTSVDLVIGRRHGGMAWPNGPLPIYTSL